MSSFIKSIPYPTNFSPTSVSGCQVWLDGTDSTKITTSSGRVTGIVDKVNSVSFSASGTDITYSTINSVQSLNFGGSSSLSGGSFTAPTTAYVFIVFTPTVSQNAFRAFISWRGNVQVGETMFGYNNSGTNGIGFYQSNRGTQSPSFTVTVGTSYIAAFSFNNTATSLAMNGALTPTNGTQSVPTVGTSPLYICFDPYTTTAVNIGEVIIYNTSSISTTDRRSIEGYLAQKWGLTASLPAGHPGLSQTLYTPGLVIKPRILLTKQVYPSVSPASIPGLVLWLDGADPAGNGVVPSAGATVSPWVEKTSGNNATVVGTPTYTAGGGITFNGSTYMYNLNFAQNLSQRSVFIVVKENVHNNFAGIFPLIPNPTTGADYTSTNGLDFETNATQFTVTGNSVSQYLGPNGSVPKAIYNDNMSNTTGSGYYNGSNQTNYTTSYTMGTCSGYGVGARWTGSTDMILGLNGVIYEILYYNQPLSSNNRITIQAYLANKWGLTSSLPAGHPTSTAITPTGQVTTFMKYIPYPPVYVTGGLILYVDAGKTASYPGSGSTWYDLSPSGLNITLYGSPTYSSSNGGYIAFTPSSSQYGATTLAYNTVLTRWTTEAWHYFTNVTVGNLAAIICKTYGGDVNFALGSPVGGAGGKNLAAAYYSSGVWYTTSSTYTLPSVGWYHIVGTYDGTNLKLYVNNVLTQTQASSQTPGLGGGLIHLMRRWDVGDYWGGYLGIARIYNRALSASEISTNYAVSKERFGLS